MQVISTISELRARLCNERAVVFVPTMGNLHEGHLNLVKVARLHGECIVVSIFVNPLQFGPAEDFDRYPRTFEDDCTRLNGLADVVFAPLVSEMYPLEQTVYVELPQIANELCGAARPGHFRGMATVVLKLLNIVQPLAAFFGKKDYQQLHIIRQMVEQFNLPVRINGVETVRAPDGLALSSRNQYLSATERSEAAFLNRMLQKMKHDILNGERNYEKLQKLAVAELTTRGWLVDYVEVRGQSDLQPASGLQNDLVILAAGRLGITRLLDNVEICLNHR